MLIIHHHLLPSPRHSHTSSISSFWVGKLGRAKIRRNPGATRTRKRGAPGACARDRERESDGVLGRARQLRLPTMAAQGGLHLRVSSRREKRQVERERLKGGALLGVTLCGAPPRREKRERERKRDLSTDRPIDQCLLGLLTSFVLLCILQRGRGKDEVIISSFSVPSAGFQGSQARGRVLGVPCCCFEGEDHPWLRDGDTAVWFRSFCNALGEL